MVIDSCNDVQQYEHPNDKRPSNTIVEDIKGDFKLFISYSKRIIDPVGDTSVHKGLDLEYTVVHT